MSVQWDCHERVGGAYIDAPPVTREETPDDAPAGDPGWFEVHAELAALHARKSGTYGSDTDPMANYVETSRKLGEVDEYTPMVRLVEKLERVMNLVQSGRADEVKDWPDIAALALGAEALRRRRL